MRRVRSKGEERVLGVPRVRVLELGAGEPGMAVRMRTGQDVAGVRLHGAGP